MSDGRTFTVEIRSVSLTDESRRKLSSIPDELWGDKAIAAESGNWSMPVKSHKFDELKAAVERAISEVLSVDLKDVEVSDFLTDIVEYD